MAKHDKNKLSDEQKKLENKKRRLEVKKLEIMREPLATETDPAIVERIRKLEARSTWLETGMDKVWLLSKNNEEHNLQLGLAMNRMIDNNLRLVDVVEKIDEKMEQRWCPICEGFFDKNHKCFKKVAEAKARVMAKNRRGMSPILKAFLIGTLIVIVIFVYLIVQTLS